MEVTSLTTAATVWLAATLGIAAGLGAWLITGAGCVIALALLVLGMPMEALLDRIHKSRNANREEKR